MTDEEIAEFKMCAMCFCINLPTAAECANCGSVELDLLGLGEDDDDAED